MSIVSRVRDAAVEAVLAGAVVGLYEGAQLAAAAGSIAVGAIGTAVATVGAIVLALLLRLVVAALSRLPLVASWRNAVAAGGAQRAAAAWRALLVVLSLALIGGVAFIAFERLHERFRFNDAGPIALLYTVAVGAIACGVVQLALVLDRRVRDRIPPTFVEGARAWVAIAVLCVLLLLGPAAVVAHAIPALTLDLVVTPSVLAVVLLAVVLARIASRRSAQIAAATILVGVIAGTWALGSSAATRGVIVEQGVASAPVARMIRSVADRDGDGYAGSSVGGADCDDANAARNPGAPDSPDNGVDENCSGADAVRATFGLRNTTRPVPPVQERPSIVVISVDALRADHLGAYGYARPTSPALDTLAKSGIRFAQAYTSCPSTRCAIPALHTGRYASTLAGLTATDRAAIPSLARVLRDAGWTTAAITCCERFAQARGELAGFSMVNASADALRMQRAGQSNADAVVDNTLDWLASVDRSRPYFAWLHLYEPHFPYATPSGARAFGDDEIDRYDAEVAYADAQIGRLVAALEPSTIVVVTSDHGEEFGEHGQRFHARSLYNQVVRVPLIVRLPGAAPRIVETPVSIVDVMPTLLELAGIEAPAGMNGRSLVTALRGGAAPARPILIELAHDHQIKRDMAAVVSPPWKVIWDREANAWSLFGTDDVSDSRDRSDDPALPELQRLLSETLDRETGRL